MTDARTSSGKSPYREPAEIAAEMPAPRWRMPKLTKHARAAAWILLGVASIDALIGWAAWPWQRGGFVAIAVMHIIAGTVWRVMAIVDAKEDAP